MDHCSFFVRPEDFKDMRVLVVGMGNTGADCAVVSSQTKGKANLSLTRPRS